MSAVTIAWPGRIASIGSGLCPDDMAGKVCLFGTGGNAGAAIYIVELYKTVVATFRLRRRRRLKPAATAVPLELLSP